MLHLDENEQSINQKIKEKNVQKTRQKNQLLAGHGTIVVGYSQP